MDLTEKIESTQVKLDTIELALDMETTNLRSDLSNMQAETIANRQATSESIEVVRREFHTRLEEAKEMAGHTRGTGNGTCAVTPPKLDGTTSWSVFRHEFENVAEHNGRTLKEKSTYLITALEGRATDMLHGISKGATYEEVL
jgi:hydroxypyruvate isomerase